SRAPNRFFAARSTQRRTPSCSTSSRRNSEPGRVMAEHSTIARPYAEALFQSVRDDARGLEFWSGLMSLLAQVAGMDEVRDALGDPRLEDAQRIELLTGLVPQALPEQAANLVALVVQ